VPVAVAQRRWRPNWGSARRCSQLERESKSSRSELKPGRSVAELEAEIRRLRAENAKLLEQREVLKKSLGILSEVPPRGMPESNR
jgi:hypothetical protein